ncbi:IS401 transposase [Ralstonia solanacearum Po82]|uniref:IS401 transposase n=1 Tax=Ralstonia solanacearum (strain Po82) TaxID=1031711 RepID=F6G0J5_RALS8|nr:IS401 transposase [Ralstonia solanacearum Po82]
MCPGIQGAAPEPICKVLQIAPSCYRRYAAQQRNPALRCKRAQRDDVLIPDIKRIWHGNWQVYGADKVCGAAP